jgi:hypothetical protein
MALRVVKSCIHYRHFNQYLGLSLPFRIRICNSYYAYLILLPNCSKAVFNEVHHILVVFLYVAVMGSVTIIWVN